mgnify:FL=1|tara:strand:- start:594 stop:1067 length:474 start_codon:yes stop_codon:yes gene_type:complete
MFRTSKNGNGNTLNHSGRSYIGETMQVDGDVRSTGSLDIAGLINGNIFVDDLILKETGSIRGVIEVNKLEVNGHVDGKIIANTVIVGKDAVIKGDLLFRNTLKTEEGADIDGYIKRDANGKSKTEEDIDIEQIIQRPAPVKSKKKPKLVSEPQKEAV